MTTLDDLELELRKLPGVRATGFTERDDVLLVQIHVGEEETEPGLPLQATRIAYRHSDRPVAVELVRWRTRRRTTAPGQEAPPAPPSTPAPETAPASAPGARANVPTSGAVPTPTEAPRPPTQSQPRPQPQPSAAAPEPAARENPARPEPPGEATLEPAAPSPPGPAPSEPPTPEPVPGPSATPGAAGGAPVSAEPVAPPPSPPPTLPTAPDQAGPEPPPPPQSPPPPAETLAREPEPERRERRSEGGDDDRVRLLAVLTFPDTDELEVHLTLSARRTIGRAAASRGLLAAVEATLDALRGFVPGLAYEPAWARTLETSTGDGFLVAAGLVGTETQKPRHGLASGASAIEAAARATLQALNRSIVFELATIRNAAAG